MAYQWFLDFEKSDRWQALAARGAQPQRLLWASTGVKDKAYRDTLYVDTLIGRDTVNTMPPATMDAFRERGTIGDTLNEGVDEARHVMAEADRLGLNLTGVTDTLVAEGVASFAKAFDDLLGSIAAKQPAAA
jgi:transaldolase/glucose-6-phosphate isomerase